MDIGNKMFRFSANSNTDWESTRAPCESCYDEIILRRLRSCKGFCIKSERCEDPMPAGKRKIQRHAWATRVDKKTDLGDIGMKNDNAAHISSKNSRSMLA